MIAIALCRNKVGTAPVAPREVLSRLWRVFSLRLARLYFEISPALSIRGSRIFARAEQDPGVG